MSCSATPADDAIVSLSEALSDSDGAALAVMVRNTEADTALLLVGQALGVGVRSAVGTGTGAEVGSTMSAQHRPRPTVLSVGEQLGAAPVAALDASEYPLPGHEVLLQDKSLS